VKRRDLLRKLSRAAQEAGLSFTIETGGRHDKVVLAELKIPVPRHRELAEGTARAIMKDAEAKLGKDWWR
jgi:hypothetical protein